MKRCPQCRRDYTDETLNFCLDDGAQLLEGPGEDLIATAVLPSSIRGDEAQTRILDRTSVDDSIADNGGRSKRGGRGRRWWPLAAAAIVAIGAVSVYVFFYRSPRPDVITGNFRSVDSPDYEYYLRGKLDASSQNRERNASAIEILENVVKADPGFAQAYAELARAYGIKADLFASGDEQKKLYEDARVSVEKALALEPNLAEGHLVRGAIIWNHVNRFPHIQTIQSLKRATALDPNLEEAHHLLGLVYYHIGLFDKAKQELQRAVELNPSNAMARFRIGLVSDYQLKSEEALAIYKTVPRDANPAVIDRAMAMVLLRLGRTDEASKIVDEVLATREDEGGNVTSVRALILARSGKDTQAEAAIQRAIDIGQRFQHFHHTTYNIASAYAMLGKRDEALKWLEFTADEGFPCYPLFEKDPNLDNLRDDERFLSLMTSLKQQWERFQETL